MKLALYGLHRGSSVDPETLARRAQRAEAAGFEGLWVGDHIALPTTAPDPADEPRLEALTALTYLAAVTTTVGLGVGVLVLPQRQPVLLAKQLTSIDVLSGGRLTVGVGIGYLEAELGAFGVDLSERASRTDEHLDALVTLWSPGPARFDGRRVSFADVQQAPLPVQSPRPPIIVGGHATASFRRAARIGDGWFGWELGVEQTVAAIAALHQECEAIGRDPAELEITMTPSPPFTPELVAAYAEVGVHRLVLQPPAFTGAAIDELVDHAATDLLR